MGEPCQETMQPSRQGVGAAAAGTSTTTSYYRTTVQIPVLLLLLCEEEDVEEEAEVVDVLPGCGRGTNRLCKCSRIFRAYGFGSSTIGAGTHVFGTVSADSHSQYTFIQSRIVSVSANGNVSP
jgi:hypothetical protein